MSKCKSCGAEIKWITTIAGKSMPCNAEQIVYWEKLGAKGKIVTPNGEVLSCSYEGPTEKATGVGYVPHFASCPGHERARKR